MITVDSEIDILSSDIMEEDSSSEDIVESSNHKLGFKPQKEIVFNSLLPFSEGLDDDSQEMLKDIKGNLGKSVLLKDQVGCFTWAIRLIRYVQMFGFKFSKEDHIIFIKLIFELLNIQNLDSTNLFRYSVCLSELLRKKELISREDLTLPWRPLFDMSNYLINKSNSNIGMYRYCQQRASDLSHLIALARKYFPVSATQEMLDLWRPELCPLDPMMMAGTVDCFDTFLPTTLLPHERALGYELWFKEFMDLWKTCNNAPSWEPNMMNLMARLAHHNVGLIDWEPHIPLMYTRILRSFNLPVYYKKMKTNKQHKLTTQSICAWIVATLGGGSSSQKYLTRMIKVLESYLHPANTGVWVTRLLKFLNKLPHSFIVRVKREREDKPSWMPEIPHKARLTEDDITQFVDSMASTVIQAMYARVQIDGNTGLQHLATLRPCTVIPPVINNMYNTINSLTEPHKYTAAMLSLVAVARPMVETNEFKEGPTHVIPLLRAMLPGIDPNDIRKCFITFQALASFICMIPIVDSSNASAYWTDLTEEEEIVCAATSEMEDFLLEFLDRCLCLVDNSVLESTRLEQSDSSKQVRSRMEHMSERIIEASVSNLMSQTSPQIFKSALHKLHTFVTSRILETTVSGKSMASICKTFSKVQPEETLKLLVPHFCYIILSHIEHEDIKDEETLDNELLYNLLLLSEVVRCYDKAIISHSVLLERVLDHTLHLKSLEGFNLASKLLGNMTSSLAMSRPQDMRSSNQDFGQHISKYLPIREWGKAYQIKDIQVKWHIPGPTEVAYVQHLMDKYLVPELDTIAAYSKGTQQLTRTELQCSLTIVKACLSSSRLLPLWDDEPILTSSEFPLEKHVSLKSIYRGKITTPDGKNVRKTTFIVISELQAKLLASAEDDVKSLVLIASILEALLLNLKPAYEDFKLQTQATFLSKRAFKNMLLGKAHHLRPVILNRLFHHHEALVTLDPVATTDTHAQIIYRLLDLATSRYSEVRRTAQGKINGALAIYTVNKTLLATKIAEVLRLDSNLHHEQFKGALFTLLGPKKRPLITQKNWNFISQIWTALVNAEPSEKPSIINLLAIIRETVNKHYITLGIDYKCEDKGEEIARGLWSESLPYPMLTLPSADQIADGVDKRNAMNQTNKASYLNLLHTLVDCINSNVTWSYHCLALQFIQALVNPDYPYPPKVIRNLLQTLIHDDIEFRKVAIRCTVFLLKQQKRQHKYRTRDVQLSSNEYGDREDNKWLQYDSGTAPRSSVEWDQPRFNHNLHVGYNAWPKEVKVNGLSSDQPPLDRTRDQMSPGEQEVDFFFSDAEKVSKLIKFLSLEDKKGRDKFHALHFYMFKNLFRNHGDTYLGLLKPHLARLVDDKHESSQRCAAEIITGLIRGSKHWPYDKIERMWQYLVPLLKTAFTNMTEETVNDWCVLAATAMENRDPNRHHWLMELLMEDPLREGASFSDSGRLSALQGALNQQGWRVAELYTRLLRYLEPKLSHPYQLLRERLGSVLTNVFACDLPSAVGSRTSGPTINQFVSGVIPQLQCLYYLNGQYSGTEGNGCQMKVSPSTVLVDEETKNTAIRLLKTVIRWVTNNMVRCYYSTVPEYFEFLPLACLMENNDTDDELKIICSTMLAAMAQSLVLSEFIPKALMAIQEVSEISSWSARATCLEFFQVFVFHNLPIISSQESWITQVNSLVLRLLKDDRVEVREKAGQMLSGLIHCSFISDTPQLMNNLKGLLSKKKKKAGSNDIAKLHAGILGLCAFISANPYDVVDPIPEIFLLLGSHLNDPQPIPTSIRKTLGDFKRTHHDKWAEHKLKFTEEQLSVLSDMVVPPPYYA